MNNKKRTKEFILYIACIICTISMIISVYKIAIWCKENIQNKEIMSKVYEKVTISNKKNKYNVDISQLCTTNSQCVGWIKIDGTNIEYPIVQASNNDYYLRHSFDKSYNRAGWIFADFRNLLDGTDDNIVIYGHNRRDGSMFGSLKNVLTKEWYEDKENMKTYLILGEESQEYEVFSAYTIEKEKYYLTTQFNDEKEYDKYINRAKKRSIEDFKVDVSTKDKLLTLSTCADNNEYRVVIHAKKIGS